ncbi:hypothetical protein EON65_33790 [archaeon]|nr:MAG: hypothetical protein EON65_33790 [archaeon]
MMPLEDKVSTIQEACTKELLTLCVDMLPDSLEDSFRARMCLRGYKEKLSHECKTFIYEDSLSLVEPCFQEIGTYCRDVVPGNNRILTCLMDVHYGKLTPDCLLAVNEQAQVSASTAQDEQAVLKAFLGDDEMNQDDDLLDGQKASSSDDYSAWPSGDSMFPGINSIFINTQNNTILIMCNKIIDSMLEDAKFIESLLESLLREDADDEEVSGLLTTITAIKTASSVRIDWVFGNVQETHYLRGSV